MHPLLVAKGGFGYARLAIDHMYLSMCVCVLVYGAFLIDLYIEAFQRLPLWTVPALTDWYVCVCFIGWPDIAQCHIAELSPQQTHSHHQDTSRQEQPRSEATASNGNTGMRLNA